MARPTRACPGCRKVTKMTRHHIKPCRWYGKKKNHHGILLCHECHMAVERIIHGREKHRGQLPEIEYFYIVIKFLEDTAPQLGGFLIPTK